MDTIKFKLLKDSFDRELTLQEREILQEALKNDSDLKKEAIALQKIRDVLKNENTSFSPFFAEKVMNRIDRQKDNTLEFAFKRIALPGLIAATILLLISILGGDSFSIETLMGVETLQPEYLTDFLIYSN